MSHFAIWFCSIIKKSAFFSDVAEKFRNFSWSSLDLRRSVVKKSSVKSKKLFCCDCLKNPPYQYFEPAAAGTISLHICQTFEYITYDIVVYDMIPIFGHFTQRSWK